MIQNFDVPIALFLFRRVDKPLEIINRLSDIAPRKVYLLSDGGRDQAEHKLVEQCRISVEKAIDWDCEIVRKYEETNIGVYENIAKGAKWVFQHEEFAIFLEDDNLPELTFFRFCKELLLRYRNDTRILWICGTNYLKEYIPEDGSSYLYTKNMMPCGWASWANKFNKYYDGELSLWADDYIKERIASEYQYKRLYYQDRHNLDYEVDSKETTGRFYSWDYQMAFTMRVHNMYAIVPKYNQIENVGVDADSTHGGISHNDVMVRRFCNLKTRPLEFPLKHPVGLLPDIFFERSVAKVILNPSFFSLRSIASRAIRKIFKMKSNERFSSFLMKRINGK